MLGQSVNHSEQVAYAGRNRNHLDFLHLSCSGSSASKVAASVGPKPEPFGEITLSYSVGL
jgi:hypothetical protein